MLQFESRAPNANILTGGEALWWSVVTITTVGYGDFYPVTDLGRLVAVFVMFAGVGIIGALASILASLLVSPAPADEPEEAAGDEPAAGAATAGQAMVTDGGAQLVPGGIDTELARTRAEMAQTRAEMAELRRQIAAVAVPAASQQQGS